MNRILYSSATATSDEAAADLGFNPELWTFYYKSEVPPPSLSMF